VKRDQESDDYGYWDEEIESGVRLEDGRRFTVARTEDQMMKPGPFDDLFTGPEDDDVLVAEGGVQDKAARNRAKRQRRKQQQQALKQAAQQSQ